MKQTNLVSQQLQVQLKLKYTSWLFITDQILRITVLLFYLNNNFSTPIFIIVQLLQLGLLIFFYSRYQKKLEKKYSKYLNPKYSSENPKITINDEMPEGLLIYQAFFGFFFSFWFYYHIMSSHKWYIYILILILSILSMAICILPVFFSLRYRESLGIISATPQLEKKFKINNDDIISIGYEDVSKKYPDIFLSDELIGFGIVELDPIDINDTRIAKLESEVKNINYRSEAWMLESVFLGGLAFSGFLTVASANFLGKEPEVFKNFISHLHIYYGQCIENNLMSWITEIQTHFSRNDLYILIMLLCLLSSVFFFLVLIIRLRLNTLSLNMDHLLRILNIFNSKEEELFNLKMESESNDFQIRRLEKIQKKIDTALIDAEKILKELKPTSTMMNTYRTIAVFLFYIVLIISGFYFMPIIAVLILSLFIFTQIFGMFEKHSKFERIKNLIKKH